MSPCSARRVKLRPHYPRRRGSTLVEILVSLPLVMLAAAAAAMLLVRLARSARAQSVALTGGRELRHARLVLAADLEPLEGPDLVVVTDTLLEFQSQLGVLHLCLVHSATSLELAAPAGSSDSWVANLRPGDRIRLWMSGVQPSAPPVAALHTLSAPPAALGSGSCGTDLTTPYRRWRLALADSMNRVTSGTAVSVHRDVRYRHYRSGSSWWLGRQSRDGALWESLQPVAGPLMSPADRGLQLEARSVDGAPVPIGVATPDTVRALATQMSIAMRIPRRVRERWSPVVDSIDVITPLRASAYRNRP